MLLSNLKQLKMYKINDEFLIYLYSVLLLKTGFRKKII
jgi:hypothetical protein